MNCGSTGNSKQWKFQEFGAQNEIVFSDNLNISSNGYNYGILINSSMPGQYDLHLTVIDAGIYSCISVAIDKSYRLEAYLAVLCEYILRISRLVT